MLTHWQTFLTAYAGILFDNVILQALIIIASFWLLALVTDRLIMARYKTSSTIKTGLFDGQMLERLHRPFFQSILLTGLASATLVLLLPGDIQSLIFALVYTVAIVIWAKALLYLTKTALKHFSEYPDKVKVLNSKTLPLFENIAFIMVIIIAIYYILVNWHIDMTAWLASAGIMGIAVGFAAKDTLANLFAGVFIMADAPYKIGDFVVLDGGERGEITKIGIRSTRLLTRDDIEVTVPNSVMGNTKIINESGGHHEKFRIRVQVGVAYGSDIDQVREVLMNIGVNEPSTCNSPEPRVRFRQFGASSLDFELCCWIEQPVLRGRILDKLNSAVYKAFISEGIEIPYAKQDIYIKEMPER